jgi:hypothetical protein
LSQNCSFTTDENSTLAFLWIPRRAFWEALFHLRTNSPLHRVTKLPQTPVEVVQPPKDTTENSIIVVMDGPRYSQTWGDTSHQYIPHMFNDMAPFGVVYSNFRNRGETNTTNGAQHFSKQLVRVK